MTTIRRFDRAAVLQAATALQDRYEGGELNDFAYVLELNTFRLRDEHGAYWLVDPRTERWYRFSAGEWQAGERVAEMLEAPDLLQFASVGGDGDRDNLTEPGGADASEEVSAIEVARSIRDEIRSGYENGTLSSSDARRLSVDHVLIDLDGGFWVPGIRTGHWYCFVDGKWHDKARQAPDEDRLVELNRFAENDAVPEAVADALPEFLLLGAAAPPEDIADPWDPPLGFPEAMVNDGFACPGCGAAIPPGSRFRRPEGETGTLPEQPQAELPQALACPSCGAAIQPGQKFCTNCGAAIADAPPAKPTCANCGAELASGARFCTQCGTPVEG
jgi:predicted nucleic acid-binding Zn ribbon protein